ncbi:unnamed protein product [Paramecium sonneborni]|uniref:FMN hydroxy acid dehydrogenase domain-containing protein n=1 Tax=Paramecium sonneborni TaxID=65129 RepID=A0A8S1MYU4_9CILI|nr:unnamed protein product [Paramecium sonneborni]
MTTNFISLRELEQLASVKLDSNAYQYYRSGANEEITKRENIDAFQRIYLNPRVLRDVSKICTKTKILGHDIDLPIGLAPVAMLKLAHPLGEEVTASQAHQWKVPFTLTTLSTLSQSEVARHNKDGLRFQQLYIQKNRSLTEALVRKAEKEGFKGLVLTVDAPILGKREADEKQRFVLPPHLKLEILEELAKEANIQLQSVANNQGSGLLKFFAEQLDQKVNWNDIKWLRSITKVPIILKGIQCGEDAKLAVQHGVDAIWVSNHGGRQLDTVRATVDMLPEIVAAAAGQLEVYVDSGVRNGTDVYKCLALGAKCVFVGRPAIYSTAIGGKEGLNKMFQILQSELISTMQLMGVTTIQEIKSDGIVPKAKL